MRRISPRERSLIVIAGAALLIFVLVFGLVLPMVGRNAELARDESEYRDIIAEAATMYEAVPAAEAEVAELRSEAARLMFPREEAKIAIVHEIDELAAEVGIRLTRVVPPGDPESVAGCLKYSASFRAESTFSQAVDLLYRLEQPDRRLWVEGVEITSGRGGVTELQINVQLAVYVPVAEGKEDDAEA